MRRVVKLLVVSILFALLFYSCSLENDNTNLKVSRPQSRWLSPNTNAISENNEDHSITTNIYFCGRSLMWTGTVSTTASYQDVTQDYSYGSVILRSGARIELYLAQPGMYDVLFTGTIYDDGVDYRFSHVILGTWYF